MHGTRTFLFTLILLAFGASTLVAVESRTFWVGPGVTELDYMGIGVRVETTDDVIVQLSMEDGEVVGRVSTAPGTYNAQVLIVVADDPERVIFQGRVVAPVWFTDYLPHETGRGEQ
jgi:hypothetical protein